MKWLHRIALALRIAKKLAALAEANGFNIEEQDPAQRDAVAHVAARSAIAAYTRPPGPVAVRSGTTDN